MPGDKQNFFLIELIKSQPGFSSSFPGGNFTKFTSILNTSLNQQQKRMEKEQKRNEKVKISYCKSKVPLIKFAAGESGTSLPDQ
jgi:hypothetical protein